jgi:hypothetical protein
MDANARVRACRARRRLRLEAKAFAALPLNLVQADPEAAAIVLVVELGSETVTKLRAALGMALAKQARDALLAQGKLSRETLAQELAQQDAELARDLGSAPSAGDGNSNQSEADHD